MRHKSLKIVDLYSGLGGLSIGFEYTGAYEVLAGFDNYAPAVATFYNNHPGLHEISKVPWDLGKLDGKEVVREIKAAPDIVIGGPPCQGFSQAGKRLPDFRQDKRNEQVFNYYNFIKSTKPHAFVMENVSGLARTGQKKENELLTQLQEAYSKLGYRTTWRLLNSSHYRVPQVRKRIFLIGYLDSALDFQFPEPICSERQDIFGSAEPFATVTDALSDLPTPIAADPQGYTKQPKTELQAFLRLGSRGLHNHLETFHTPQMLTKLGKQQIGTRLYPNWNHSWYRLHPDKPSPTVKENHRAPFVHPIEDRAVSPRECARLQTIPDRYVLHGTKSAQLVLVGNAVPSILGAHIATAVAEQIFRIKLPYPWRLDSNPMGQYIASKEIEYRSTKIAG